MTEPPATESKGTVSLVLGSGGARGLAHIGVIRYLNDAGYRIQYIAGSSMGALIGGIYATGKLDLYSDWVCSLRSTDVLRLFDVSLQGEALFKGDRVIGVLREMIGEHEIADLPIGFTAVATDLNSQNPTREVWLNKGPLFDAIRASIAVPTVFSPVHRDGQLLVDGSVANPVPVGPTLNEQTDLTIAVNLNGKLEADGLASMAIAAKPPPDEQDYRERISAFFDRFLPAAVVPSGRVSLPDLAIRSMEAMQQSITTFKSAASPPDLTIHMPRNLCGFFEFHRAELLIRFGYQRAERALERHLHHAAAPASLADSVQADADSGASDC